MAKYTFALMDEKGKITFHSAPSKAKAIRLEMKLFKKMKIIACSKIAKNTPDAPLLLPAMFHATIAMANS